MMMMPKSTKIGGGVLREPEEMENGNQQRKPWFDAARHITRPEERAGSYNTIFYVVTDVRQGPATSSHPAPVPVPGPGDLGW